MIAEYSLNNFKWIDVQAPTEAELQLLRSEYGLDFNIVKDLSEPISDTRVVSFDNQHYLAFHHTTTESLSHKPRWQEIDIIVLDNLVITVVYEPFKSIAALRQELDIEKTLKHEVTLTKEQFLTGLVIKVHQDLRMLTAAINSNQRNIEEQIFNGGERQMVRTISETGRVLFNLNQTIAEQRHLLKFLPTAMKKELANLTYVWERELEHTGDQVKAQYDLYHDLRRTNEELLTTKQNEVMRKLTLVAFITSPLTILAGIFGMNTRAIPFIGSQHDFWIVIGIMVTVIIITMLTLKSKGWFE